MTEYTYYKIKYGTKSKRYLNITEWKTWIDEHTDNTGRISSLGDAEHMVETLQEVYKCLKIIKIVEIEIKVKGTCNCGEDDE